MWAVNHRRLDEIGPIITAQVVATGDEVTLISAQGMVMRTTVKQISQQGRATKGTRVMRLEEGDLLRSVARIPQAKEGAPADGKVDTGQAEMELAEQGKSEEIEGNNGVDADLEEIDEGVDELMEDEEELEEGGEEEVDADQ